MIRRPPRSTRTDTLFPYTTLFRSLDISGRPYLVFKAAFSTPRLGEMDTELFEHWFHSFAGSAGITLHVENLYGSNNHHIIESCFKAVARALRSAVEIDPRKEESVPSTKGSSEERRVGKECVSSGRFMGALYH